MQMTADEICRSYKNAVDPKKQIGILAELNATDKASIKAILIDAGLMEPEKKSGPKAPQTKAEMDAVISEGIRKGMTVQKIAEDAGCTEQTVKNHKRALKKAEPQTAEELERAIAEGLKKGQSVQSIAAVAGCAENTVRRWMRKMERGDDWEAPKTEEEKEARIAEGIQKGMTAQEIAEYAGCSETTVRKRMRMGNTTAPEKPGKPVRSSIPVSARVTAVIHAIPESASTAVKVKAFDLCKELLEGEAL